MNVGELLHAFVNDITVQTVAVLIALDFVLGVTAALKNGAFKIGWLHGFLYTDVLAKLVPFFAVYAGAKVGASNAWFETIRDAVFATVVAGMTASILGSLRDLGFAGLPDALAKEKQPAATES